jgi:hypothetical protein
MFCETTVMPRLISAKPPEAILRAPCRLMIHTPTYDAPAPTPDFRAQRLWRQETKVFWFFSSERNVFLIV